jgi:hypothetical protein
MTDKCSSADIVERIRHFVTIRGGPAKDDDGQPIATSWQMMLDAADEIERLCNRVERLKETQRRLFDRSNAPAQAAPVAYAVFTDGGNIRIWSKTTKEIEAWAAEKGLTVTPLYAAQPPAASVEAKIYAGGGDGTFDENDEPGAPSSAEPAVPVEKRTPLDLSATELNDLATEAFNEAASRARSSDGTALPPVKRIEMVDYSTGFEQSAAPQWRVEVSGICADFETETAANNFRNAIVDLITVQPQTPVITDEMVKAGAAAICCQAGKLGCAAKNENSEFATCVIGTFMQDSRRCLEAALAVTRPHQRGGE